MSTSSEITVRFPFTHIGEGSPFPEISRFSDAEKQDIRKALSLCIDWDPYCLDDTSGAKIISVEVIYDGITHIDGTTHIDNEESGYWLEDSAEYLSGYPAPILQFKLDKPMEVDDFLRAIMASSMHLQTEAMRENNEDICFLEDHSGYVHAITDNDLEEHVALLKGEKVVSGKVFNFPDGMMDGGEIIPCTEFALSPR